MKDEELNHLLRDCEYFLNGKGEVNLHNFVENLRTTYFEPKEKQISELKEEIHTWKEASSTNSYKAFQLQEENKILSQHIVELQNDKGELTDRCRELEAQIEKMKCCENCKYNSYWGNELHCNYGLKEALQEDKLVECKDMDKWEIKEK